MLRSSYLTALMSSVVCALVATSAIGEGACATHEPVAIVGAGFTNNL